ncbi:MAG: hypothetical protein ACK5KU_07185, partial [Beutenbergiaceae bacterium]
SAVPAWRVRAMSVASPTDEVESVLTTMQVDGTHMALVKAESADSSDGVVFLEDILEELVGEVRDLMQRKSPRR